MAVKQALIKFGIGFIVAIVVMVVTLWLNMRHSAPGGPEWIHIPRILRGPHTWLGGLGVGVAAQIVALVYAVRQCYRYIDKTSHKVLFGVGWAVLLISTLVIWAAGSFLVMASWCV